MLRTALASQITIAWPFLSVALAILAEWALRMDACSGGDKARRREAYHYVGCQGSRCVLAGIGLAYVLICRSVLSPGGDEAIVWTIRAIIAVMVAVAAYFMVRALEIRAQKPPVELLRPASFMALLLGLATFVGLIGLAFEILQL